MQMAKDKDVSAILQLLPRHAKYYFTNAQIARAMSAQDLADRANAAGLHGEIFENVHTAVEASKKSAHNSDLIIVCGSVFLVGETNFL
jgi:dihydrofolate synthase/folylpolyglutamate synthase